MPYWSSSKVGADPQGQVSTKSQPKKSRFKSRRGITMEDLKKQTAVRLAQEQQKKGKKVPAVEIESKVGSGNDRGLPSKATIPELLGNNSRKPQNHSSFLPLQIVQDVQNIEPTTPSIREATFPIDDIVPASLSNSSFDSSQHGGRKSSKSKLPHGLTVQELKEMTKARLEAEASEAVLGDDYVTPMSVTLLPPPEYRDQTLTLTQLHSSPIPNGYGGIFSPEAFGYSTAARDALETASVSTATSEIPASESVYSGAHGPDSGLGSITFSRSGSYPRATQSYDWHSTQQQIELTPPSFVGTNGITYFDRAGLIPNRRRAATLSPRPGGVALSHQDQSLFQNHSLPLINSMSLSAPGTSSLQHRLNYSDQTDTNTTGRASGSILPSLNMYNQSEELNNTHFSDNRIRTSSCVSAHSPLSQCDDFLSVDSRFANENSTRNLLHTKQEGTNEASIMGLSSVFRGSLENSHLNSKFPQPPARKRAETEYLPAQTDLFGNGDCFSRGSALSSESRMRAATWGEPSLRIFGGFNLFGTESNESGLDDRLADDLASILKLSGVEQKDSLFPPPGF